MRHALPMRMVAMVAATLLLSFSVLTQAQVFVDGRGGRV